MELLVNTVRSELRLPLQASHRPTNAGGWPAQRSEGTCRDAEGVGCSVWHRARWNYHAVLEKKPTNRSSKNGRGTRGQKMLEVKHLGQLQRNTWEMNLQRNNIKASKPTSHPTNPEASFCRTVTRTLRIFFQEMVLLDARGMSWLLHNMIQFFPLRGQW